jgi:hypothetical protein
MERAAEAAVVPVCLGSDFTVKLSPGRTSCQQQQQQQWKAEAAAAAAALQTLNFSGWFRLAGTTRCSQAGLGHQATHHWRSSRSSSSSSWLNALWMCLRLVWRSGRQQHQVHARVSCSSVETYS